MPAQVTVTREINAPADKTWAMVADVTRMHEWSPENASAEWLKGATTARAGASFKGTNRNGNRAWSTVATVVEADPGRAFRFRVKAVGMPVAEWGYSFEPTETGCRVTESWTDLRNPLIKAVSGRVTGVADRAGHNRSGMEETLDRLAAAAEA